MSNLVKSLLSLGITIGLSDRETFVKKVSGVIEEYQADPERAEKWSRGFAEYLEQLKSKFQLENTISSSISDAGLPKKETIEDLTRAINKLTEELKHSKGTT
jgi:hypothetical protein